MARKQECKEFLLGWLNNLQEGDRVEFKNGYLTAYNSFDCEIDSVRYE